jgi:hypothetical protein
MSSNGTALAKNKALRVNVRRVKPRRRVDEKSSPKFVDYHSSARDFQCVLLASIGWSTLAISNYTGLTEGQVAYRIEKSERGRRKGDSTQRTMYRQGRSGVAHVVVQTITKAASPVSQHVATMLDKRGLYDPKPTGILRHDPRRVAKSGLRKIRQ